MEKETLGLYVSGHPLDEYANYIKKNDFPNYQLINEVFFNFKKQEIEDIDTRIDNSTQYYNDNISVYNTLLKKFPSNIIATFCKYEEKLFFDRKNMNDDDYEDFKL